VRLLVFIVKIFVTMHGHMNVKLVEFCRCEIFKIYDIIEDLNFHVMVFWILNSRYFIEEPSDD
jgi:hypothetical protein